MPNKTNPKSSEITSNLKNKPTSATHEEEPNTKSIKGQIKKLKIEFKSIRKGREKLFVDGTETQKPGVDEN